MIFGKRVLTRIDRKIKGDGSEAKLPVFKNRTKESIDGIFEVSVKFRTLSRNF